MNAVHRMHYALIKDVNNLVNLSRKRFKLGGCLVYQNLFCNWFSIYQ
jgi:hypothetical protein